MLKGENTWEHACFPNYIVVVKGLFRSQVGKANTLMTVYVLCVYLLWQFAAAGASYTVDSVLQFMLLLVIVMCNYCLELVVTYSVVTQLTIHSYSCSQSCCAGV